jgi:hypothetical protein
VLFTVSVDLDSVQPLTMEQLEDVAAIGGVSIGSPGDTTVGAAMTVAADDALLAGRRAVDLVTAIVGPGRVVGCEALTTEEFDRREALWAQPA